MNSTKQYLLRLRAQFESEGKQQKLMGCIWLSPRERYEILKELLLPVAEKNAR